MIEIPGYKIHREIDSCDYCNSYSAIQLSTGKTMVVSVFSHSATQYTSFQSFFNKIEKKLAHHVFGVISPIKEFIKTSNHTYIISDLLSNSCQQIYKEKTSDIEELFNEFYKIALSLELYHQIGFYHGGVTLDNLFHDNNKNLILGLAAFNQNFSSEDKSIDLEHESYQAPEKEVSLSKSRDFYALGVVLYELIFKQKPFIADSLEKLNKLKMAAIINISDEKLAYLKPLFSKLLNPDPSKRIATANEFKELAQNIGIKINEIEYSIEPLNVIKKPLKEKNISEKKKTPKFLFYGAAAIIVAAISIAVIPNTDNSAPVDDASSSSENLTEEPPQGSITEYTTNDSSNIVYDESDFDQLIKSAKSKINNRQFATALMSINQALKIHPNDKNALIIQKKAQSELKINAIISQADAYIKQGSLLSPVKSNALTQYKKLQKILPKGDQRAINGFKKISNRYYAFALNQFQSNDYNTALENIRKGLTVSPNHLKLKQLQDTIIKENKKQQEIQYSKALEVENNRLALIQQQKLQQILTEKNNLKHQQIERRRENERKALILKKQNINRLYHEAENDLEDTQLSIESINNAFDNLKLLEDLETNSAKNLQLKFKINNAYISLAEYQISTKDFLNAENTINIGLKVNPKNLKLQSLKNKVNVMLTQQNNPPDKPKKKELPIFGTF